MLPRIVWFVGVSAMLAAAPIVRAQDLSVTPLSWVYDRDNPTTLPDRGSTNQPEEVPAAIEKLDRPSYVRVRELIGEDGAVLSRSTLSEFPWLDEPARETFLQRRAPKPALRNGKPVISEVEYFVVYNPATAARYSRQASPRLTQPVAVVLPNDGRPGQHAFGEFWFDIDEAGHVVGVKPASEKLAPTLVREVQETFPRWKFAPARSGGKAVRSSVTVPVLFLTEPPINVSAADSPAIPIYRESPIYPEIARRLGAAGRVMISFVVDVEGQTRDLFVLESSHPVFERAAMIAIKAWRFRPARKNGLPVAAEIAQPITFHVLEGDSPSPLQLRYDPEKIKKLPPQLQWDKPPVYVDVWPAVYPFDALSAEKEGSATVVFIVGPNGRLTETKVFSATDPAFGGAALAMLETFTFLPASKQGKPTSALLRLDLAFSKSSTDLVPHERESTLIVNRLKAHRAEFSRPDDLDRPLWARFKPEPKFPLNLKSVTEGEAEVEFVIDSQGVVRAPHVLSATAPEFGYAAAQAVSRYRYAPPRKNRRDVEVLLTETIKFHRGSTAAPAASH